MPKRRKYKKKSTVSKLAKKARFVALAMVSIFLSTLVLVGFSFYKFINAPFSSASNIVYLDSKSVWDDNYTNIILIELTDKSDSSSNIEALSLIHLNSETKRYVLYKIPIDVEVSYALNYGFGDLRSIYKVGNQDQDRGIYLLSKTISKLLAVRIDGYIAVDKDGYSKITSKIGEINPKDLSASIRVKNFIKIPALLSDFRKYSITNLNVSDIKNIIRFIRNTSETSSKVYELNRFQLLDDSKWDELWRSELETYDIKKEAVKVFIANASEGPKIAGLAGWGARIVQNLGASVLDTQNSFVEFNENTIITDDAELQTVKRLAQTLNIQKIVNLSDIDKNSGINPQVFRTSVSLVLVGY